MDDNLSPLLVKDFERFSLDRRNRLYFDGRVVEMEYALKRREFILAVLVALIAFANAYGSCWNAWSNYHKSTAPVPQVSLPCPASTGSAPTSSEPAHK